MKVTQIKYGTIGVYCITNTVNGKKYVGSSKDCRKRLTAHKCKSQWNNQPNNPLYLDMQKFGLDKFECELLLECSEEKRKEEEQRFIQKLKPEYNLIKAKQTEKLLIPKLDYTNRTKDKKAYKKWQYSRLCCYEGEMYTLRQLETKFVRIGIPHPTKEAYKYLLDKKS